MQKFKHGGEMTRTLLDNKQKGVIPEEKTNEEGNKLIAYV